MSIKHLLTEFSNEIGLYYPIKSVEELINMVKGHRESIKHYQDELVTDRENYKKAWKAQVEYMIRQQVLIELRTMTIGELADIDYKEREYADY